MPGPLSEPLRLPCGQTLPNRLVKAAMTEGLGDPLNRATERHVRLYKRWADAGMGLLISGNVQIDRKHLERAGNVVIDGPQSPEQLAALKAWTTAAKSGGAQVWAQIAHSGRQTPKAVNPNPSAPSAVKLALPGGQFGDPRAMTADEVKDTIKRFAHTAAVAREGGFTGVQIHAAHGYLLSEFLSPRVNQRTDEWGGSLENRARAALGVRQSGARQNRSGLRRVGKTQLRRLPERRLHQRRVLESRRLAERRRHRSARDFRRQLRAAENGRRRPASNPSSKNASAKARARARPTSSTTPPPSRRSRACR